MLLRDQKDGTDGRYIHIHTDMMTDRQADRQAGRHVERVRRIASLTIMCLTDSDVWLISVNIFILGVSDRSCVGSSLRFCIQDFCFIVLMALALF